MAMATTPAIWVISTGAHPHRSKTWGYVCAGPAEVDLHRAQCKPETLEIAVFTPKLADILSGHIFLEDGASISMPWRSHIILRAVDPVPTGPKSHLLLGLLHVASQHV